MKAVVLAGGEREERFHYSLMGKRIVEYPLEALSEAGYDVYLLTSGWEMPPYATIFQRRQGVIGAIRDAVEELGLPLLLSYGDVVAEDSFYTSLKESCSVAAVASIPSRRHGKLGGEESSYVFAGLLYLDKPCYSIILERGDLVSALNFMISKNLIKVVFFDGVWHDVDKPEDILVTFPDLLMYKTRGYKVIATDLEGVRVKGPVLIEDGAEVEPFVFIEGPAFIGEGAKVKAGAVIRKSSIERGAIVRENAVVSNSSVQPGKVVGPNAVLEKEVLM